MCFIAELGTRLRVLKVDLIVACVKTCWILLFPKTLHYLNFLEELPVPLWCSSCHPTPALPLGLGTSSCPRCPDHHASAVLRPLWFRPRFQSWIASFLAYGRCLVGVSISDLPWWPAAKVQGHVPLKTKQHKIRIFTIILLPAFKISRAFWWKRDIFCACFNSADKMMVDPLWRPACPCYRAQASFYSLFAQGKAGRFPEQGQDPVRYHPRLETQPGSGEGRHFWPLQIQGMM